MAKLIMYLLESSALLAFFYLIYVLVLRKETFFNLNRLFLLGSLIVSSLFPLVSINFIPAKVSAVERPIQEISKIRMSYYDAIALWEFESRAGRSRDVPSLENKSGISTTNWINLSLTILLLVYAVGIVVCLSRTVWTIRWIRKMINMSPKEVRDGVTVITLRHPIAPFSFFQYVFVHDAMIKTPEFDHILAHEKTHIEQRHSIDLIFVQLLAAFFWFNPVIWRLLKSLKTTHEYIADKKIISTGYSLVEYQTLLLKQLISNNSFGLVHNFNLSFIKKRITMMKNKRSGLSGKVRVGLAITTSLMCSALIIQCNSRLDDENSLDSAKASDKEFTSSINLPLLPQTGFVFEGDPADALYFAISGDRLAINGEPYELGEIVQRIQKDGVPSVKGHIVMQIDKDQRMDFVRNVEMELRKADRRKVLYVGKTAEGIKVETLIVLPPPPGYIAKNGVPEQPTISEVEAEGKTDILKIDAGDNAGIANQKKVYEFVKKHMQKQSTEYVVSLRYDADDKYNVYLPNLIYVKEGFNQIYQERSQNLFGKNYYAITKEEYNAVRKNVPMAISIAEK